MAHNSTRVIEIGIAFEMVPPLNGLSQLLAPLLALTGALIHKLYAEINKSQTNCYGIPPSSNTPTQPQKPDKPDNYGTPNGIEVALVAAIDHESKVKDIYFSIKAAGRNFI